MIALRVLGRVLIAAALTGFAYMTSTGQWGTAFLCALAFAVLL